MLWLLHCNDMQKPWNIRKKIFRGFYCCRWFQPHSQLRFALVRTVFILKIISSKPASLNPLFFLRESHSAFDNGWSGMLCNVF